MSPIEPNRPDDEAPDALVTGEEVELPGEAYLEDVTPVGEVTPAAYDEEPETVDESPTSSSEYEYAGFEEFDTAPERSDVETTAMQDVLGNRGEARFSETDETMVTSTDTGVLRRSLVESTQPLSQQAEVPVPTPLPEPAPSAESILAGATVRPSMPSRAGARVLSAFAFIFLTPLAWYLLADAGARFVYADTSPWASGNLNIAALLEFTAGLAVIVILGVVAAQSALGLLIAGILVTILGLPFLAVPGFTATFISDVLTQPLESLGAFGENILFHLTFTGSTGILTAAGVTLIVSSWVVSRVRQKGRAEEALRAEIAAVNPEGLRARWARKASGQ